MTIRVTHPPGRANERAFAFKVVLGEFLGLPFETEVDALTEDVRITLGEGPPGASGVRLPDRLFRISEATWLSEDSLPQRPLRTWRASCRSRTPVYGTTLPVIFGSPVSSLTGGDRTDDVTIPIDIFGSVFFMLTRYEEMVLAVRDEHGRFPADASLAIAEGFIDRPIVDEYVECLWAVMKGLWPRLQRRSRKYKLILTHDVDTVHVAVGAPARQVVRAAVGDLVKHKEIGLAYRRLRSRLLNRSSGDPANTFQFIMTESEARGIQSEFYFRADSTERRTCSYSLEDPTVMGLIRDIHHRGHKIGLHTSYQSYMDAGETGAEFGRLLKVAAKLNVNQERWGGRQHFLRWENPATWRNWESAGLDYDSTLGYANHVGFRCGTCHEYPAFDLLRSRELRLRERPLLVMDTTLLNQKYMAAGDEESLAWITRIAEACRRVDGSFVLLWHNTHLMSASAKRFYSHLLGAIVP